MLRFEEASWSGRTATLLHDGKPTVDVGHDASPAGSGVGVAEGCSGWYDGANFQDLDSLKLSGPGW